MGRALLMALGVAFSLLLIVPLAAHAKTPLPQLVLPAPAESARGHVIVTASKARILAGPAAGRTILKVVSQGDTLPVEGKRGDWYFVRFTESARGWIRADAVANYEFPAYLLLYQPPENWVPPSPDWVPPPGWVPPSNWKKRSAGWVPPPRWHPKWWDGYYPRAARPPKSEEGRRPPADVKKPKHPGPPEGPEPSPPPAEGHRPGEMERPGPREPHEDLRTPGDLPEHSPPESGERRTRPPR